MYSPIIRSFSPPVPPQESVKGQVMILLLQKCYIYRIVLYFGGAQLFRIGHLEAFHETTFTGQRPGK